MRHFSVAPLYEISYNLFKWLTFCSKRFSTVNRTSTISRWLSFVKRLTAWMLSWHIWNFLTDNRPSDDVDQRKPDSLGTFRMQGQSFQVMDIMEMAHGIVIWIKNSVQLQIIEFVNVIQLRRLRHRSILHSQPSRFKHSSESSGGRSGYSIDQWWKIHMPHIISILKRPNWNSSAPL